MFVDSDKFLYNFDSYKDNDKIENGPKAGKISRET